MNARNAIETLYIGRCTVTKQVPVIDDDTKQTGFLVVDTIVDEPCRLSFEKLVTTSLTDGIGKIYQGVKLFIAPDVDISPGSKITVTQNNVTTAYKSSGQPGIFSSHQEIKLDLFDEWS